MDRARVALPVILALLASHGAAWAQPAEPGPARDDIAPGEFLVDVPTLENLGFRWYVEGDSNRNASVEVSYRPAGRSEWSPALPMLRVHHEVANQRYGAYRCGNLFAGSVMFLQPGTEYELRFVMRDPDGGSPPPKMMTVATRAEPVAAAERTIHVYPQGGTNGGRADAVEGLMAAYRQAGPGDVLLLHAGTYRGPFVLDRSGEPERPITFRGAADGETILEGPDLKTNLVDLRQADNLVFENLTFRRANIAVNGGKKGGPGASGLTIRRCRIEDVISGIWTTSEDSTRWYLADNVLIGMNPRWYPRPDEGYMEPSPTGINVYGQGHIVCHNRISRFSDAIAIANFGPPVEDVRKHCVAIDFYNNDLSFAQDDCVETDYGCHNVRVYRNRCMNAHTALSSQPFYGGPCYFIGNEMYGITSLPLKLHNYCTGLEIYHNTCTCARQGFRSFHMWQNARLRNNLFLGAEGYALETGSPTPYTTVDYNGYRRNSDGRFLKWFDGREWFRARSLMEFRESTGHEEHGLEVDYDVFVRAAPAEEGRTYQPGDVDLRLRAGSVAVDAGEVLPNVNDRFGGRKPDLGCHELGQPLPHYGPRPEADRAHSSR